MRTRNISLTPALDRLIEKRLKSGQYDSASEVVRTALRALEAYEVEQAAKTKWLQEALEKGLASGIDRNYSVESVLAEARRNRSSK
jgi:antitoxin ParD1/3/4